LTETPAGESEEGLDERLPSWALGIAFVLIVAMLPVIVVIALVSDLSEAQMDVFNVAMGIIAVILGAGFGIAIQAGNVRAARRERDRERSLRVAEVEEERGKRAEAVRAAVEAEQLRSAEAIRTVEETERARSAEAVQAAEDTERIRGEDFLEQVQTRVLETLERNRGPRIRSVTAAKLKSAKFLKKARKSKDAYYVRDSAKDKPAAVDHDALTEEVAEAFEAPDD
jgi:hypothetical protein